MTAHCSSSPTSPSFATLADLLALIPGPAGEAVRCLYRERDHIFREAPGSLRAHQAWPGGYLGHITECLNIGVRLYATLNAIRPLPFTLGDLLLVLALHDIEKPARYVERNPLASGDKSERAAYRQALLETYDIRLTPEQENAMRFVEGEFPYIPGERQQGPLAAVAHAVDVLSARLWFDHPAPDHTG